MDRFAALEAFVRVAESGSFSEAARWMQLAPSVVSKRIVDLERDFGVTVFHRTTRSVSLTNAGEVLLARAGEALAALDEARRDLGLEAAAPRGRLRIGAPTSFGALVLAPLVCEFRARHPGVEVELILADRPMSPAADGFDLVVDDTGRLPPAAVARALHAISRRAVAAPGYLRRRGMPAEPGELRGHDCIHYSELESGTLWRFVAHGGSEVEVRVSPVLTSNSGRVMLDAATSGQGIAVLPHFLVDEALAAGDLSPVLAAWQIPPVAVSLVHTRSAYTPLRARLMREFLMERLGVPPRGRRRGER